MQFINYFSDVSNIYTKKECPHFCRFKPLNRTPIVGLPKPDDFWGVIISEDPTTDFIGRYEEARKQPPDEWRRLLMSKDSPPSWLIQKMMAFNKKYWNGVNTNEITQLNGIIQHNFYWTHMLKCCTIKSKKLKAQPINERISIPYTHAKGVTCADTWLSGELSWAISQGSKCIVTLGKSPEIWSKRWFDGLPDKDGIRLFNLPHPSGANQASWNPKTHDKREKLSNNLLSLLEACGNKSS